MRFACQSCGKAYNLPEERIADKSNVKLKCRVCGAIVEVKKHGELVARTLSEEGKPAGRVSEAPAPLTSITPEDDSDDGATVSISEASLNDPRVPLEIGIPGGPGSTPGFSGASFASPPVLDISPAQELEPPPPAPNPIAPPPPLADGAPEVVNGKNGGAAHFAIEAEPAPVAPVAPSVSGVVAMSSTSTTVSGGSLATAPGGMAAGAAQVGAAPVEKDDTFKKMVAAFLTGVLVDRLIAGLFF